MNASKNITSIATELGLKDKQVEAVVKLLEEGATIPFMARYRKEVTGSLDEVVIASIRDRFKQLQDLDDRRASILKSLEERGLLTDQLKTSVDSAATINELEDVYLPYRVKRKTRATAARERGLEPLAQDILAYKCSDPLAHAGAFVNEEKGVKSGEEALSGARDIIAEIVSEHADVRKEMRSFWSKSSNITTAVVSGQKDTGEKYQDYFAWSEPVRSAPSHRILAMLRGEKEGVLRLAIEPPIEDVLTRLRGRFLKGTNKVSTEIDLAIQDSVKRLLGPSMENELRATLKTSADTEAIRVFANNLRQLLLAPPLGPKRVLAIDPGLRTGCKIVCLSESGKLEHHDVLPLATNPNSDIEKQFIALCQKHRIEAIAIGNGTGGREAERFVRQLVSSNQLKSVAVFAVNESGASVYSASEVARDEFPDQDVTVRGAVSIGRRLMDPLAELVKIDPKAIGVGQYQHDVDQGGLKDSLDDVVVSCVNAVGVEVNTASKQLLAYVSGIGPQLADNIVKFRHQVGVIKARDQLRQVPRLGPKAFEQCGGFLRIREGDNPLDATAVHPERYKIVRAMADDCGCSVQQLIESEDHRKKINPSKYVSNEVGMPTLTDIMAELAKPGRDPRTKLEPIEFADGINKPEDLKPGMKLPGVVTNITAFGAFVDIGVHQDGLVHISQLADKFVKDPNDVVKVGQKVTVSVLKVEADRKRISLSLRSS